MNKLMSEALEIAEGFNWAPEMPDAVEQMRRGIIPDGFGRLVGQTIALFLQRPIIGGWLRIKEPDWNSEENRRATAKRLARLRLLIAQIHLAGSNND